MSGLSTYGRSGPPNSLVVMAAISAVLGCIALWVVSLQVLDIDTANATRAAQEAQQQNITQTSIATINLGPSPTPVPECIDFEVDVDTAIMRTCPDESCQVRQVVYFEQLVCVYSFAETTRDYPFGEEWYVIDLNGAGAFRDLVYMHRSVVRPVNPTPRPSLTYTPLPSITPTPLRSTTSQPLASITPTPQPDETPQRAEF